MFKNVSHRYIRHVKHEISFSSSKQRDCLKVIKKNVMNYIEEHPNASYNDLIEEFGTPREVALAYFNTLEIPEITQYLKWKRTVIWITVIICIVFTTNYLSYLKKQTIDKTGCFIITIEENTLSEERIKELEALESNSLK